MGSACGHGGGCGGVQYVELGSQRSFARADSWEPRSEVCDPGPGALTSGQEGWLQLVRKLESFLGENGIWRDGRGWKLSVHLEDVIYTKIILFVYFSGGGYGFS